MLVKYCAKHRLRYSNPPGQVPKEELWLEIIAIQSLSHDLEYAIICHMSYVITSK